LKQGVQLSFGLRPAGMIFSYQRRAFHGENEFFSPFFSGSAFCSRSVAGFFQGKLREFFSVVNHAHEAHTDDPNSHHCCIPFLGGSWRSLQLASSRRGQAWD
jgi:hypothetical protein